LSLPSHVRPWSGAGPVAVVWMLSSSFLCFRASSYSPAVPRDQVSLSRPSGPR